MEENETTAKEARSLMLSEAAQRKKKEQATTTQPSLKSTQYNIYALAVIHIFPSFLLGVHNDKWYQIHQCQKILETVTLHFNTIFPALGSKRTRKQAARLSRPPIHTQSRGSRQQPELG
jgi:hypothetical protein